MDIRTIGVIGAGQMGNGIAHVCALAGLLVTLLDIKEDALTKARSSIDRNMDRQVSRGAIDAAAKAAALARISTSTDYAAFADSDLVIEASTEKEAVKRAIFATLVPHLKPSALIASNTSSISITRLGASTDRPEKFIGMHFMNPVPVMKLVEIIRGIATDEVDVPGDPVARRQARQDRLRSAEDFPAFIVNRILVPMINEAVYALYEGVGSVERHRHGAQTRREPQDGSAGTRRTSSASIPASRSCRCSTRACRTASTAPARSW